MKRAHALPIKGFSFGAMILLLGCAMTQPTMQQQEQKSVDAASSSDFNYLNRGIVEDWTTHHVVFSNPGTREDAIRNGKRKEWERIVTDPRYRMQWVKRYGSSAGLMSDDEPILQAPSQVELPAWVFEKKWREKKDGFRSASIHADWALADGGGLTHFSVGIDVYPAKYTFAPIGTADCTNDFVIFPLTAPGSSSQADLIGANNLYSGTCTTGTVPNVLFAYDIGSGVLQTSPVLSEDGTKVAFVESVTNGSIFHVLKLDKSGNGGCPSAKPCNGTAYNAPVAPGGTLNDAVDTKITMSGGVSVTRSSPFVDYQNDIAYVGDDSGVLHKFTGVFQGTPAEAGSPWPFTVASGVILDGPVFDSGTSQNIFVGGSDGNLYCVKSTGAACATASITVGAGGLTGGIEDAPIVDSTAQTVFATANTTTNVVLTQATTQLGSQVNATMGLGGRGGGVGATDQYNGAFDNAYFTNISTGHMYFCGNETGSATPELWRVTFNASGTMSSTNDGNSFQLVVSGNRGTAVDCTPLTEVFNSSQNTDNLFLGVTDHGFIAGTPDCGNTTCIMSFVLPQAAPFTFPTTANATLTTNLGNVGISAMIIDNVSGLAGASQIYFGNPQNETCVQASQSALK